MPYENNIVIVPTVSQYNTQKQPITSNSMSSNHKQCEAKNIASSMTSEAPVSDEMANVSTNKCNTAVDSASIKIANIKSMPITNQGDTPVPDSTKMANFKSVPSISQCDTPVPASAKMSYIKSMPSTNQLGSSVLPASIKVPTARGMPLEVSKITSQETSDQTITVFTKNMKDKVEISGTSSNTKVNSESANKFSASDTVIKKKSCASWASNYLQSIGQHSTTTSKLINKQSIKQKLPSVSTYKQTDTTDKKNGSQEIKLNLLSREKPTKTASFKIDTGNENAVINHNMDTNTSQNIPPTFANQHWIPHQTNTVNTNFFRPQTNTQEWHAQQPLANTILLHNSDSYSNNIITTVPEKQNSYTFRHYYTPSYMSPRDYTWLTHESYANTTYQPTGLQYEQPNNQNEIKEIEKQSSHVNGTAGTSSSKSHQVTKSSSSNRDKTTCSVVTNNKENNHHTKINKHISTELTKKPVISAKTKVEGPKCNLKSSDKQDRKNLDSKIKKTVDKMRKFSSSVKESVVSIKERNFKIKQVKKKVDSKEFKKDKNEKHDPKKRSRSPDQPNKKSVRKEDTSSKKTKLNQSSHSKLDEKPIRQKQGQEVRSNYKVTKEGKEKKIVRNRGFKDEVSKRPQRIEKCSEHSKKRVHRDSSSELQPNKRFCSNSKKETTSKKISPMKSVVKLPKKTEIKHPRIQAPEDEGSDNDDFTSDFDLRSKLSRLNYENHLTNKKIYENNRDNSIIERENLVISVNRTDITSNATQSIPGPSKPNKKAKKYKKIQLVINVICKDQEDSSDNSSSDENDQKSKDIVVETEPQIKPDLSFLDDINIDEIVNSLKNDANTQKNIKQMMFESSKKFDKPIKKFVQPIVIKREIKAEPIEPNICNEDESSCLSSQKFHESVLDDEDTLSLGPLNNEMDEQSIENIQNAVNEITNRIQIGNMKQKNQISEARNFLQENIFDNSDIVNTSDQNETAKSVIHKNNEICDKNSVQNIKQEIFQDNPKTSNHDTEKTEQSQKLSTDKEANKSANDFKLLKIAQPFTEVSCIKKGLISDKTSGQSIKQENIDDNSNTSNHENEKTGQTKKICIDKEANEPANNFKLLKIAQSLTEVSSAKKDLINFKSEPCDVYDVDENQEIQSQELIAEDIENTSRILHNKPIYDWTAKEILNSVNIYNPVECEETVDNTFFRIIAKNKLIQEENNNDVNNMKNVIKENNVVKFSQNVIETTKSNGNDTTTQKIPGVAGSPVKNKAELTSHKTEEKRETTKISAFNSNNTLFTLPETEKNPASVTAEISPEEFQNNKENATVNNELCNDTNVDNSAESITTSTVHNAYSEHNSIDEAHTSIENKSEEKLAKKNMKKIAENRNTKPLHPENIVLESKSAQYLLTKPSSPTVKTNNNIENNKQPTKTMIDSSLILKPGPSAKSEEIARPETEEQITPCNSSDIPNTMIDHNTKEAPENAKTDQERTVTIMQPSLKSDKVLALKIEKRILEYLKLDISIISLIHTGKFSKIFKCKGADNQHYGLKIILNKMTRFTNGIEKEKMLLKLQEDIPKANLNTIYFISGFGLQQNWCFLLEYYPKNLRQVLHETIFNIDEVHGLARQLVSAVMVMRNNNIIHSDIKPTHILLDASNKKLKVCGFDEAYHIAEKRVILPNLGSSFYRAPEIILGYTVGFGIDVWATALVIYEMVAGRNIFNGFLNYNNSVLFYQLSFFGYVPYDMIQNSRYANKHFIGTAFKKSIGSGPSQFVKCDMHTFNGKREIFDFLMPICSERWTKLKNNQWRQFVEDMKKLLNLCKLLDKMLVVDPRQRIPIEYVYADSFFMDKMLQ